MLPYGGAALSRLDQSPLRGRNAAANWSSRWPLHSHRLFTTGVYRRITFSSCRLLFHGHDLLTLPGYQRTSAGFAL